MNKLVKQGKLLFKTSLYSSNSVRFNLQPKYPDVLIVCLMCLISRVKFGLLFSDKEKYQSTAPLNEFPGNNEVPVPLPNKAKVLIKVLPVQWKVP